MQQLAQLYYNATIKHLGEYSHAKRSVINGFEYQIQKLQKHFISGNAAQDIAPLNRSKPL
jgi:hypothetical protein